MTRYYHNTKTSEVCSEHAFDGAVPDWWQEVRLVRRHSPVATFISRLIGSLLISAVLGLAVLAAVMAWTWAVEAIV